MKVCGVGVPCDSEPGISTVFVLYSGPSQAKATELRTQESQQRTRGFGMSLARFSYALPVL